MKPRTLVPGAATRTIVISDCHASKHLISNAVEHAQYEQGVDRLIFLGDVLDIGPDPKGCFVLLEELGAEMTLGNHEHSVAIGQLIYPQDPRSWWFEDFITERIISRSWGVALLVEGVVLSHAGFGSRYDGEIERKGLEKFVDDVNARFFDRFMTDDREFSGDSGPLWYRPSVFNPPAEITQIVGHTPPELLGKWPGYITVDPYARNGFGKDRYRYATIVDGDVAVYDSIDSSCEEWGESGLVAYR